MIDELSDELTDDEKEKEIKKINIKIIKQLRDKYTVLRFDKVPNCQYLRELMREHMTGYEFDYSFIKRFNKSQKTMIKEITKIYEDRKNKDGI